MTDLSIVVVNYNTAGLLRQCLSAVLEETRSISFDVIVVDNGSSDGSREMLEREFPQVTKIYNQENRGFATANNQGWRRTTGRYVLLLNSDTRPIDGAIQKVVSFMDSRPDVHIAGCRLLNPDGSLQPSARAFPTIWNTFCETAFLYRLFPESRAIGGYYMSWFAHDRVLEVDWLRGAFLMCRRNALEELGGLDEDFFMYSEEVDFCFRAKQHGFSVWFYPDAETVHVEAASASNLLRRTTLLHLSQARYIRKHFRGPALAVMLFLKYVGVAIRIPAYFAAGVLRLNRSLLEKSYYYLLTLGTMLLPASRANEPPK